MHTNHNHSNFKKRFIISVIGTIPILLLSPMIQSIFAFAIVFPGSMAVLLLLANCVYGYGGWPFIKGCILELKEKKAGMMTLVAMAITTAHFYSIAVMFKLIPGKTFFWEVATLIDVMLLGHWIEMRTIMGASSALEKLSHLLPATASLVMADGSIKQVEQKTLKPEDKVLIKPGEKVPADGVIIEGHSDVNEAALTGESKPIFKTKNDTVIGGSFNQNGSLVIQVTKDGSQSYITTIVNLVEQASRSKSRGQLLADKAAFALTILAITVGTGTLIYWLRVGQSVHFALERMISVMVITCPHALGLAIPLVVAGITAISAKQGLLIKNRKAFEQAYKRSKRTVVVFDKTGTLTTGKFGVTKIKTLADWNEEKVLKLAAAIERKSEHSIAKAIVDAAHKKNLEIPYVANFKAIPGVGAIGFADGNELFVGSLEITAGHKLFPTNFILQQLTLIQEEVDTLEAQGRTVIIIAMKNEIKGIIALSDLVREESLKACKQLRKMNMKLAMITGDNENVAHNVAEQLGITHVFAKVLPHEKVNKIKELQEAGKNVIMVGDGINDAPALAQADVGVAIGSGTDIAAETADIILVENDPRSVVDVIKLSQLMRKKMLQNLGWATGYNLLAIPLAAGALYHQGIILHPAVGALLMSVSTMIVAINARSIKQK